MENLPGQQEGRQIGLSDITRMLRERRLFIGLFVVGASLIGGAVSYVIPERFDASTVFLLKERSFLSQLYGPAFIQIPFKNNLSNIQDDILSYANLDQVGRSMGLDKSLGAAEWDSFIETMRGDIVIDVRSQKFADDVITLSYSDGDANRCYRLVNRLRDAYIESNVAGYQEEIRKLMDRYRSRIKGLEGVRASTRQNMTKFMQSHQKEVNGGAGRNVGQLDLKQRRLEELDTQIASLDESARDLKEELTKQSPKVKTVTRERNPQFEQLRLEGLKLRRTVSEMEKIYTEIHPDMIEARASFAQLEKDMEGLEEFIDVREEIKDNDRYYALKVRIRDAEKKAQLKKNQKRALETEVAVLNNNLKALPALLERQREMNQRQADAVGQLTQTKGQLRRMEDLWERSKEAGGTVYQVVEQGRRPRSPSWPDRPLIVAAAMAVGLALSLALTYLLEMSRQTFGSVDEASLGLGVPVMGAIELIVGPDEILRKRRRKVIALVGASFVILVGIAFFVVYQQFPEALPETLIELLERL